MYFYLFFFFTVNIKPEKKKKARASEEFRAFKLKKVLQKDTENFAAEELLRLEVRQWSVLTPGRISQLIIPQLRAPTVTHRRP